MTDKKMGVFDAKRFGTDKTAMLSGVTRADRYRINTAWYGVNEQWEHGRAVDEFNLGGMYPYTVGDVVTIINLPGHPVGQVQIVGIRMVNLAEMTDTEYQALGYQGRADFLETADVGDKRGWLVEIAHLSPVLKPVGMIH